MPKVRVRAEYAFSGENRISPDSFIVPSTIVFLRRLQHHMELPLVEAHHLTFPHQTRVSLRPQLLQHGTTDAAPTSFSCLSIPIESASPIKEEDNGDTRIVRHRGQ